MTPLSKNPDTEDELDTLESILMGSKISATTVDMNVLYPKLEALIASKEQAARYDEVEKFEALGMSKEDPYKLILESWETLSDNQLDVINSLRQLVEFQRKTIEKLQGVQFVSPSTKKGSDA